MPLVPQGEGIKKERRKPTLTPPPHLPWLSVHIRGGVGCRHSAHDAPYDARDSVQVVNATCVLDSKAGLQDWLGGGGSMALLRQWLRQGHGEPSKNTGFPKPHPLPLCLPTIRNIALPPHTYT